MSQLIINFIILVTLLFVVIPIALSITAFISSKANLNNAQAKALGSIKSITRHVTDDPDKES